MSRIGTILVADGEIRIDDPFIEAQIAKLADRYKTTPKQALIIAFERALSSDGSGASQIQS